MMCGWPVRLAGALAASAVVTGCGGGAGVPGLPSAYLGTVLDRPVPGSVADLPLITDAGQPTTLAAFRGQVVVLADFLTLCQETCPLTAGNLLVMDRAFIASGLASGCVSWNLSSIRAGTRRPGCGLTGRWWAPGRTGPC
jgi:hypothetical protein